MTQIKAPLPEKYELGFFESYDSASPEIKINQLIDYLTELAAVVEGKADKADDVGKLSGQSNTPTPTLKERLLEEIKKKETLDSWNIPVVSIETVEAIINRVIPD
jgi:hypothetical protein